MELEDLKRRWEENDAKLDRSIRLNTRLLQSAMLGKADTSTRWLSRGLTFELLLNLVAPLCLGMFIANHVGEVRFLVPAVVLHLCAIAVLIALVHQLVAIQRIDYSAPIVEIQKRLESLRVERIRTTVWTLLVAPLLWTPLLIVGLKGLFGVDAYVSFGAGFLAANALFGLLVLALALWVSRRYAARMGRSPLVQQLMQALSGQSLADATQILRAVARFEEEGSQALG
jgi:hypothetical protein